MFQLRSSWARIARFWRIERLGFPINSVLSLPLNIPTLPASTIFSSCYDLHAATGFPVPGVYPSFRFVSLACAPNVCFQLLLTLTHPRCIMLLGNPHSLMPQENGDPLNRHARKQKLN